MPFANSPRLVTPRLILRRFAPEDIPAMLANITAQLSGDGVNVENMTNKSRGDFAYTLVDVGSQVEESVIDDIRAIDGIIRVRVIS